MRKILSIEPLGARTVKTAYIPKSSFIRALSVITPQFVYYYINQIVTYESALFIGRYGYSSSLAANNSQLIAALIRILALVIAVAPLLYSFAKEYPVLLPEGNDDTLTKKIWYVCILSMSIALFLNALAAFTGFMQISVDFEKTAENQFSLPLGIGILVYGIITPVTEEVVHRGIIYNRLRRYFGLSVSVVVSSLLFGVSHGNPVQLVYGFVMGILICLIYERYGAFIYPVLFHCIANTMVYIVVRVPLLRNMLFSLPAVLFEIAASLAFIYMIFGYGSTDKS